MSVKDEVLQYLNKTIIGEIDGLDEIASSILLHQAGLSPEDRPIGSFFVSGPTGTGKTYLVEVLAIFLHNNHKKVLKIDCGSYAADHEVARLIGAPPGYLGHKETPPLFNQERIDKLASASSPIGLVLFDEADKAHDSMQKLLLSILDKGELRLGDNSMASFTNTMVFFTSNYGQEKIHKLSQHQLGFSGPAAPLDMAKIKDITNGEIRKVLRPEFMNRIDHWITFPPLTKDSVAAILKLEIAKVDDLLKRKFKTAPKLTLGPHVKDWLIENGYSKSYGARPIKRLLRKTLLEPLAEALMVSGDVPDMTIQRTFRYDLKGDAVRCREVNVKEMAA